MAPRHEPLGNEANAQNVITFANEQEHSTDNNVRQRSTPATPPVPAQGKEQYQAREARDIIPAYMEARTP
jgi:hypothetical protein